EINTWVWLQELSREYGKRVTLSDVPREKWDALAALNVDAIWFMGVWARSPAGIAVANRNPGLLEDFRRALPDFRLEDNVGSPYCVKEYSVDRNLGGPEGLAAARRQLADRGMRLLLDFVPNHVAPDHPWVSNHPEYLVQGSVDDARRDPTSFCEAEGKVFACGRDPYFPAWPDVLQLNAFAPGLRQAALQALLDIAGQCDGIRCDMAMLMLNEIFARTWGARAGQKPERDYWAALIPAVKAKHPEFKFIAEAYWDLEWELQQQGFEFCYDKRLYDRLERDPAESVRLHVCADMAYQNRLVRFIENHDEPRAASAFPAARQRAAAVTAATLPGARLLHEGQFEGRKVRLPVFLGRRPDEDVDLNLQGFYRKLLSAMKSETFREGNWFLCDRSGWPDNQSFLNLVAWCWEGGRERYLVIVNLSGTKSQGKVRVPREDLKGRTCALRDLFSGAVYDRRGDEIFDSGLYVDLEPWGFHFLKC
ncbi:MAG TPA: alpha-amylase family glycosyl hydrolase, partial [Thermodesulfobacteriota bacterium]|nr:alpha-amylase family glycosyl hydrolase [Thermodesulfobacteriota bacterium]